MSNYMMRYKGRYRLKSIIDMRTNDFVRNPDGSIDDDVDVFIECKNGVQIYAYGQDGHREMQLAVYCPTLQRGHNILKEVKKQKIAYAHHDETDKEVVFTFSSNDLDKVAAIAGAKTYGANISPFSLKNLSKSKDPIPDEEMAKYKEISSRVGTSGMTVIKNANSSFCQEILAKKLRNKGERRLFDYKSDMKLLGFARNLKGYIYIKGLWEEYLNYLSKKIDAYLNNKE